MWRLLIVEIHTMCRSGRSGTHIWLFHGFFHTFKKLSYFIPRYSKHHNTYGITRRALPNADPCSKYYNPPPYNKTTGFVWSNIFDVFLKFSRDFKNIKYVM